MARTRGITRYVEDLLRSRRPRPFRAGPEDAALARAAITLRAARPGSTAPSAEFVAGLHERLAAELEGAGGAARGDTATEPGGAAGRLGSRPRRAFVRAASFAAGAAAAGAAVDHVVTGAVGGGAQVAGGTGASGAGQSGAGQGGAGQAATIRPAHGAWRAVLASADLPDGSVRSFVLDTVIGFVERDAGRLRAVSGVCTHQGCRLMLAAADTELACPCHGATFALDGSVLRHRLSFPLTALPRLAVRERDGTVQVWAPPAET